MKRPNIETLVLFALLQQIALFFIFSAVLAFHCYRAYSQGWCP